MNRLNSHQLRDIDQTDAASFKDGLKRRPLYFILDNVYDTYNIGGLFRLADALAVSKIYLCGDTETPPNHKIMKASVGTYKIVPWEYCQSAGEAIEKLRATEAQCDRSSATQRLSRSANSKQTPVFQETNGNKVVQIVAVEQSDKSIPYTKLHYSFPCALVLGNESFGVSAETLELCDGVAEIPMWGVNKSLNVIVSAAIVGYEIIRQKERI